MGLMKQVWCDTLEVEVEEKEGYPCVRLHGEGERRGAERLAQAIERLIAEGSTDVIVDARSVRFLDPHCARALEEALQRLQEEGGTLVLVDQSPPVERTLKLLGLEQRAHVAPTVSQAVHYLEC
jgi:anti-anti-sigma factor